VLKAIPEAPIVGQFLSLMEELVDLPFFVHWKRSGGGWNGAEEEHKCRILFLCETHFDDLVSFLYLKVIMRR
jgi:hypothetical protein